MAKETPSVVEIKNQLVDSLKKDKTGHLSENVIGQAAVDSMIEQLREMRPGAISSGDLQKFESCDRPEFFSESTSALVKLFREKVAIEIKVSQEKLLAEFMGKIREFLMQAFATSNVVEISKIREELGIYHNKNHKIPNGAFLDALPKFGAVHECQRLLYMLSEFYACKNQQDWLGVGNQFSTLEEFLCFFDIYLSDQERADIIVKLRDEAGILTLEQFEIVYQQNLEQLLNPANQDRIEEILKGVVKQIELSNASTYSKRERWEKLDSFGLCLMRSIERVRNGDKPQITIDSWTRSNRHTTSLAPKEQLIAALAAYKVKVLGEDGKEKEVRLYYTIKELKQIASDVVLELFDDANQDRLEEIQRKIREMQSAVASSSDFSQVSQHWQRIQYLANRLTQTVQRIKSGESARNDLEELLRSNSESEPVLERKKLLELLKAYKVKVTDKKGQTREMPIYQDLDDIIARINKLEDIEAELGIISQFSHDGRRGNLAQEVAVLSALAELHKNLKSGNSFALSQSYPYGGSDWTGRSGQLDPESGSVLGGKLVKLREEAECAVLKRVLPGETIADGGDREEMVNTLLKKLIADKNYQGAFLLGRVATHFQPNRPLFPVEELFVIQSYLNGVRQIEELHQPRIATVHLQRAAAARSNIIPTAELKMRLGALKKEFPGEYDKGTRDSMLRENSSASPSQLDYRALPSLVVPSR